MRNEDIEAGQEYVVSGYVGRYWDPTDIHVRVEELITIEPLYSHSRRERQWRVTWVDSLSIPLTDSLSRPAHLPGREIMAPWDVYLETTAGQRDERRAQDAATELLQPLLPDPIRVTSRPGSGQVLIVVPLDEVDHLAALLDPIVHPEATG